MKNTILTALVLVVVVACATSPTGRKTIKLLPAQQMNAMGIEAYQQLKKDTPISKSAKDTAYVSCVADAITRQVGGDWEVTLFEDESPNAFALPGGKIGVHTGMLAVAENQHQLAAVLGHEVAHVIAEHGNERASASTLTNVGMVLADAVAGAYGVENRQTAMALLGIGAQVGALLPFSRTHESEADELGLVYMADAGFDPRQAAELWRNMARQGGGSPPEFLSTHPSHSTRIDDLTRQAPKVMPNYEAARKAGRAPNCRR